MHLSEVTSFQITCKNNLRFCILLKLTAKVVHSLVLTDLSYHQQMNARDCVYVIILCLQPYQQHLQPTL